jgi:hypothetical protein
VSGRRWQRGLGLVGLVLASFAAGTAAAFVHRTRLDVGVVLPVGMVACLAGLTGLLVLARMVGRSRAAVGVVAAAFALPVLVMSQFRPEGDLVVTQDPWGLTLLGGIALVVTTMLVVPFSPYHGGAAGGEATPQQSPSPTQSEATPSP